MPRVLVVGDVQGQFRKLYAQVTKIQDKSGTFDALFCVGTFFDPKLGLGEKGELAPYLSGEARVPVPTYFICGAEGANSTMLIGGHPNGVELCKNLTYLGRHGRKDISGLKVCFLSGVYEEAFYGAADPPTDGEQRYYNQYHEEHVEETLIAGFGYKKELGVDILLTAEWGQKWAGLLRPNDQPEFFKLGEPVIVEGSPAVHRLCGELSMKYHFAAHEGVHYALTPYRNFQTLGVSRFYAMATFGNTEKAKALQAFSVQKPSALQSSAEMKANQETYDNATLNPYTYERPKAMAVAEEEDSDDDVFPDMDPEIKAKMVKPMEMAVSNSIFYGNIDPDTGMLHGQSKAEAAEEEEAPLVRMTDFKHKELPDGDWQCGYCGNINLAERKQTEKCNMRRCEAARYLDSGKRYGMMTPAQAAREAAEKAEEDRRKNMTKEEKKGEKRQSLYVNQAGGMAAGAAWNGGPTKKKKF